MKVLITIDTEGDNQWDHGRVLSVDNIKFIPRFQDLCNKYLIKPTYLVTSEICEDAFAREIFTNYIMNGQAEIGAHLHSWTTPPYLEKDGFRENDINHAFASELPYELVNQKISNLTENIATSFGQRPSSFRSGRYGFNEDVARALVYNKYLVDSSVTPYVSWAEHKGIPGGSGGADFIDSSAYPHRFEFNGGSITEIPITIMPTRHPLKMSNKLAQFYFRNVNNNFILKGLRKLFFSNQPVWLRPVPGSDLNLLTQLVNITIHKKLPFITMMFHSSELMPGCSKYRPDDASVEELYRLLERFFKMMIDKEIHSVTLTEAAQSCEL